MRKKEQIAELEGLKIPCRAAGKGRREGSGVLQIFMKRLHAISLGGLLVAGALNSQELHRHSSEVIVRDLLKGVASEVVIRSKLEPSTGVTVVVDAKKFTTLVENAFFEALSSKGYRPFLGASIDSSIGTLTVNVLGDPVRLEDLGKGLFERSVDLELQARFVARNGGKAEFLGEFSRSYRDTVASWEIEETMVDRRPAVVVSPTTFERMAGPLIVLAGSILVVFLLFTVRS
jgi:hypothetical protein